MNFTQYIILCLFSIGTIYSCGASDKMEKDKQTTVNQIDLDLHMYPTKTIKKYSFKEKKIAVNLVNPSIGLDSLVLEKDISLDEWKSFSQMDEVFKAEEYSNKCMEDGQVLSLHFLKDSLSIKDVRFINFHHDKLEELISFINSNMDDQNQIYYDRKKLIADLKNCN